MVLPLGDIAGILILLNRLYRTVRRETREARESAGFRGGGGLEKLKQQFLSIRAEITKR